MNKNIRQLSCCGVCVSFWNEKDIATSKPLWNIEYVAVQYALQQLTKPKLKV